MSPKPAGRIGPMTRHNNLRDFIDLAFARSTPLCRARFGELVADYHVDERAGPLGFERALIRTDAPADVSFAIVIGDDPNFRRMVPDRADDIHIVSDDEFYAYWRPAPERVFYVFDRLRKRGVTWFPGAIPAAAYGQPCEVLINAAIETTGWCIAHAGAVGRGGEFLLLVGPGKAGKSTATLACVQAGWQYAGDDVVLLHPQRGLVAPLFSSARLRQTGVTAFQSLADTAFMVTDDEEEEAPRYELRLDVPPTGGRVRAILGLRRLGNAGVRIGPARATDYMGPLLRDSTARAPGCTSSLTPKLLAAGRMAPAFVVDTGTDPAAIPDGLGVLLKEPQ
jgi:hypothetical protein